MNLNNFTIKSQGAIQKAQEIAAGNKNQSIENIHILKGLMTEDENVIPYLLKKQDINTSILSMAIDKVIESLPKVSGGEHFLSREANTALQKANSFLNDFNDQFVSVEHILLGILSGKDTAAKLLKDNGMTEKSLMASIKQLRQGSTVDSQSAEDTFNALNRYAKNLNELARTGKLDPVIGREEEIRRILQILSRRTKNNPILIGEPGVGKTAIAEGLAHRIINGDVPENLKSKVIFSLDM
ncbi:MAG: type VI secretion system ATPase TssH, partial [Bacteroidetes bacterium]